MEEPQGQPAPVAQLFKGAAPMDQMAAKVSPFKQLFETETANLHKQQVWSYGGFHRRKLIASQKPPQTALKNHDWAVICKL